MATPYARWVGGDRIRDYALPGDEDEVCKLKLGEALKRDSRFNDDELDVYLCGRFRWYNNCDMCVTEGCETCGSPGWWYSEPFHDTWP
jgi:hypothetical protein